MNKYIILVIFLSVSVFSKAQLSFNYSVGYGQYQMGDMKDLSDNVMSTMNQQFEGKLKMTDNFPAYITQNAEITYQLNKHEFGVAGGYMSSGSRFAYSDYSGRYVGKIKAHAYKIGLVYKYHFYETDIAQNHFSVFGSLAPTAVLSSVDTEDELQLYQQDINLKEKENLLSSKFGLSIQPMLGCRLILYKHFLVHVGTGYDFEFGGKINPNYRVDWSGFRLNGGVGLMF